MTNTHLTTQITKAVDTTIAQFLALVAKECKVPLPKLQKLWQGMGDDSVESSVSEVKKPVKRASDESESDMKPLKNTGSESDDESLPVPKKGGKKPVDSDDDSVPAPKKGGKKPVDSDDDSVPAPKKGGKKPVDSDDDSVPAPKRGKKAADSDDDSVPAPKKGKGSPKKAAPKKGTKVVYEEADKPKDNADLVPKSSDLKFLKGTNYIVRDGVVVGGFGKNGVMPLGHMHLKALTSETYENIKHEVYDKAKLNKVFKCDKLNEQIKSNKPPVKRGKKN